MEDPLSHHPASQSLGHDSHSQASSRADSICGNLLVLAQLSVQFWIISAREAIKEC